MAGKALAAETLTVSYFRTVWNSNNRSIIKRLAVKLNPIHTKQRRIEDQQELIEKIRRESDRNYQEKVVAENEVKRLHSNLQQVQYHVQQIQRDALQLDSMTRVL